MTSTTTRTFVALALAAAIALPACTDAETTDGADGDGSTAEPVAADADGFVADVEARCATANEEIAALEEEFPDDTPESAIGYLGGWADAIESFTADVRAMEVPPDLDEGTETALGALDDVVTAMRDAVEKIEGGNEDVEAVAGPAFGSLGEAATAAGEAWGINLETCGEEAVVADADATQVAVTAIDYDFEIPEVPAGPTAFTMTNEGEEPHFMFVVRLQDGIGIDEALAAEDPESMIAAEVGESATVVTGESAVLNADLEPGTYAMLCFIGNADGVPHAELGMAREFTVG